MALLVQVLFTGLAAGAAYGLVAISYTVVYRLTGVVHFALGELISLGLFVTLLAATGAGPVTHGVSAARFALAIAAGLATCAVAGLVSYLLAVRPFLRWGSPVGWIGGTLAVAFAVRGLIVASFTRSGYLFPDPFTAGNARAVGVLSLGGGVTVPIRSFFVIALGVTLAVGAAWVLRRTEVGRALQATAQDRFGAAASGLPVEALFAGAFAAAGLLAAVAGMVVAPSGAVSPDTGTLLGLKGLIAAVAVGFASPLRSFVAALALGILESTVSNAHVGGFALGSEWRDVIPLATVLVALTAARSLRAARQERE